MNYKIIISKEQSEDIIIYAKEKTQKLARIEELLSKDEYDIYGYNGQDAVKLDIGEVFCFFTESGKVYALTEEGKLFIKERLYVLEERFSKELVRINQSCLISILKIARFRTTFGGALQVILKNGYTDYVSRRQIKEVKERMGI